MSELIEVHQLDYKACSLTYGEGACTAEAGTRPAGYGVASFNGTTSKIDITPFLDSETTPKEFTFKMIFTGSSDFDYKIYREYPSGLELSVERVSGNYFGRLNVGGATATNQITGVQLNTEHEVSLKIYRSGTKTRIEARLDGSGGGLGEANGYINAANITTAEIGKASSNGNSFEIRDFKAYKNGVLVRDLPLNGDVTDATGNTTPTATDVTFETVCPNGTDPQNASLCALVQDPNKKCFNTYATCQDTPNYTATTKTLTFTKQNSALPKQAGSTVGFFPSITSSSTQSAELNVGARRFDLNTLGKSSSASITMTDAPYSDNLTDPYVSERTYNPLERGTFWGKFLAQNPYYSGDEYRIYTGEAGQNISDMDYKRYLVDKITLPNSGGSVSINCVDQLRTLDFDKAIFLDAGTITINGSISVSDSDILTNYPVGTTLDLPDTLQPYFKLDDEVIKFGNLGQQDGYYKFESCIRSQFGTTAATHENSTIQLCHYFEKSTVLPSAQAGLYFHLKTLYNDAGFSDSLLDLSGWETEISSRLSLYDDVKRLVHEPTPIADLIGELQRDCGFFMWFDEYDKKMKMKAVRPEIEAYSIDEYNHILAGTAQFNVESQDRITELWFSYDMPNKVLSVDNLESYAHTLVSLTDKANPNQYGQRIVHRIKSPWIQSEAQAKRTSNRIVQRYDDSTIFCNFMLDRSFSVRMGQVFKMAHSGTQNADGSARSMLWQVIGIDRVQDKIKIKAQQFYLDAGYGVWGDNTIPNYDNSTDEQKEKYAYWGITKWG